MRPSGIEPATFRLVVQFLNQMRYRMPHYYVIYKEIFLVGDKREQCNAVTTCVCVK